MTAVTSSSSSCSCGSGDNFALPRNTLDILFCFYSISGNVLKTFAGTSCGTLRHAAQPFFLQIHAIWLITNSHLGRQLVCNHFALFCYFGPAPAPGEPTPAFRKKKLLEGHLVVRPGTLLHTETCLNLVPQWDRLSPPWVGLMDGFPTRDQSLNILCGTRVLG